MTVWITPRCGVGAAIILSAASAYQTVARGASFGAPIARRKIFGALIERRKNQLICVIVRVSALRNAKLIRAAYDGPVSPGVCCEPGAEGICGWEVASASTDL